MIKAESSIKRRVGGCRRVRLLAQLYIVAKEKYRRKADAGASRRRAGRDSNARRDV